MPSEDIPIDLRRVVLPIVAINSKWRVEAIGTAFVVLAFGKYAIALTAAHCLQHIARLDAPYPRSYNSVPPWLPRPVVTDIDLEDYKGRVLYPDATGNYQALYLAKAYAIQPSDIAVCRLEVPHKLETTVKFEKRLIIDSSPPKAHTNVIAVGYADMTFPDPDMEVLGDDAAHGKISLKLNRRPGRVLEVYETRGPRNESYPCFTSSIPFDSGMSGGPVLDMSDGRACAIGVISYDLSLGASNAGCGECAVSSILWPAMATKMKGEELDDITAPSLIDFERVGLVEDRGKAHQHIKFMPCEQDSSLIPPMYWSDDKATQS
jgi:hypothetical protein